VVRVLVGGFGEVARRGIREILQAAEFVVDECGIDAVMSVVCATRPDALVVDTGPGEDVALAVAVAVAHPGVTVVACSTEGTAMRVYPRSGGGQFFSRSLSAAALVEYLRG